MGKHVPIIRQRHHQIAILVEHWIAETKGSVPGKDESVRAEHSLHALGEPGVTTQTRDPVGFDLLLLVAGLAVEDGARGCITRGPDGVREPRVVVVLAVGKWIVRIDLHHALGDRLEDKPHREADSDVDAKRR